MAKRNPHKADAGGRTMDAHTRLARRTMQHRRNHAQVKPFVKRRSDLSRPVGRWWHQAVHQVCQGMRVIESAERMVQMLKSHD